MFGVLDGFRRERKGWAARLLVCLYTYMGR